MWQQSVLSRLNPMMNQLVLLFSAIVSVLCCIAFGLSPVLKFSQQRTAQQLRAGARIVTPSTLASIRVMS